MNLHADPPAPLALEPLLSGTSTALHQCSLSLRFLEHQILLQKRDPKTGAQLDYFISPQDAAACFLDIPSDSGWLPKSVVRHGRKAGQTWVVVYAPPHRRRLCLDCDNRFSPVADPFVDLHIPFPGLCCLLSEASAWAWALKGNSFQSRSIAYNLPLPNVSHDGLLCFGAQDHPLVNTRNANSILEIWLSGTFVGHQTSHKSHSHEEDVRHLLWDIQQRQPKQFPADELVGQTSIDRTIHQHLANL